MIFSRGDLVLAPFRYTDIDHFRVRPTLVVSETASYGNTGHVIAVMVTLAVRSDWPFDIEIRDCKRANLLPGSRIRFKVFTIAESAVQERIGRVDADTLQLVIEQLRRFLT